MKTNTPAKAENKPAHEIRLYGLRATIWKNESEKGTFYNTTFERNYRAGEEWKSTDSFGRDDLLTLAFIAQQCFAWIAEQRAK